MYIDLIIRTEKEIERLARDLSKAEQAISQQVDAERSKRFPNDTRVSELNERLDTLRQWHARTRADKQAIIREAQAKQSELDALEAINQQQQADRAESLTKMKARRGYIGTDTEFEQEWAVIWQTLRAQKAVDAADRDDPPVNIRF
jgi:chromosome segregation ATPase